MKTKDGLFKTENLVNHVKKFALLAGYKIDTNTYAPDIPVNDKAAKKMARLHDKLKDNGHDGHALEVYLIRLLYCMFADDSFIFEKEVFYEYIKSPKEGESDLAKKSLRKSFCKNRKKKFYDRIENTGGN